VEVCNGLLSHSRAVRIGVFGIISRLVYTCDTVVNNDVYYNIKKYNMAYLKMFEEFPEAPLNLPGARATSASFKTRAGNSILVGLHLIGRILINDCFYCLISVNDMKTRP